MKRRTLAAVTAVVTATALAPAAGAYAAGGSGGKKALTNSGVAGLIGDSGRVQFSTPLPAGGDLDLALQLPQRNQALADSYLANGTVVSTQQYGKLFGASPQQVAVVSAWARTQGFRVTSVSASSAQVMVTAPANRINKAFGVTLRSATFGATRGYAAQGTPTVPASTGLTGVSGLTSLHKMKTQKRVNPYVTPRVTQSAAKLRTHAAGRTDGSRECSPYWGDHLYPKVWKYSIQSNIMCGYKPSDLATMYGSKGSTAAPTLGVLLWYNNSQTLNLTNTYMRQSGYPALASSKYSATVAKTVPGSQRDCAGASGEQDLDVQSTHAVAPNAAIAYYGAGSCYDVDLTRQLQLMVDQHKVSTISMSFGSDTDAGMSAATKASWDRPLRQAALTGISAFASTGDAGDNSFFTNPKRTSVSFPAANSYLTAVGGTTVGMRRDGSFATVTGWESRFFRQYSSTAPGWADITSQLASRGGADISGGGGGLSSTWAQPTWQKGIIKSSPTRRALPDISALADPTTGFITRSNEPGEGTVYQVVGGTSLASPIVAALVGVAKATNKVSIGNVAPNLYAMRGGITDVNAPAKSGSFIIDPVTNQSIVIGNDAKPQTLVSGKGWDSATGLGTPNGAAFLAALK